MERSASSNVPITEKLGYGLGDAAANLVWRGVMAFAAAFYTDTLGIGAAAAATLMLVVRLSDGITDIIMGMIADRTKSRHGRFRPWILWSAPFLGIFMALTFTAPDVSPGVKLVWAYFTYIGLTLAYTVNNVPYSALMGVMTPSHLERTSLAGFRFAGAFLGGMLVTAFTPKLIAYFGGGNDVQGYKYTFYVYAVLIVIFCSITFFTTRERVSEPVASSGGESSWEFLKSILAMCIPLCAMSYFAVKQDLVSGAIFAVTLVITIIVVKRFIAKPESETTRSQRDLIDLITNKPWLLVIGLGLLTMFFNGVRTSTTVYYFTRYMGDAQLAGSFFFVVMTAAMVAALTAGFLTRLLGKKQLFGISLVGSGAFSCLIMVAGPDDVMLVFVLGAVVEFFAAYMPVLAFSMLGDAADYSEWKSGRRATGLFFSAGTFIQKLGNGFAGALVLLVLASAGYVGTDAATYEAAKPAIVALMSWVPALFAFAGVGILLIYPLNTERMVSIEADLTHRRSNL